MRRVLESMFATENLAVAETNPERAKGPGIEIAGRRYRRLCRLQSQFSLMLSSPKQCQIAVRVRRKRREDGHKQEKTSQIFHTAKIIIACLDAQGSYFRYSARYYCQCSNLRTGRRSPPGHGSRRSRPGGDDSFRCPGKQTNTRRLSGTRSRLRQAQGVPARRRYSERGQPAIPAGSTFSQSACGSVSREQRQRSCKIRAALLEQKRPASHQRHSS